jgi:hypothetical protein
VVVVEEDFVLPNNEGGGVSFNDSGREGTLIGMGTCGTSPQMQGSTAALTKRRLPLASVDA